MSGDFPRVGPPLRRGAIASVWGACVMLGQGESVFVGRVVKRCVCEGVRDDNLRWVMMCNSVFCLHAVLIQVVLNSSVLILRDSLHLPSHRCSHFG